MSTEKRFLLFVALSFLILVGSQPLLEFVGLLPKRAPAPAVAVDAIEDEAAARDDLAAARPDVPAFAGEPGGPDAFASEAEAAPAAADTAEPDRPALAAAPQAARVEGTLVLGAADPSVEPYLGYQMRVELTQLGAGVSSLTLAHYESEPEPGKPRDGRLRLVSIQDDPAGTPVPFALSLIEPEAGPDGLGRLVPMDEMLWEVVPDDQDRLVRPVPADSETGKLEGQEIVFRATDRQLGVTVTKTYRLRKGMDDFELRLGFESDQPTRIGYRLNGPHGLPIEGTWYTSTFREAFFGKLNGESVEVETRLATEIVDRAAKGDPLRVTTLPLRFAGVENQYFAVFFAPDPPPTSPERRVDEKTMALPVAIGEQKHLADVTVAMDARPLAVNPGNATVQSFRVFAGPKTSDALAPYGAEGLADYRKGWQLPGAATMARYVISPLLKQVYALTEGVSRLFGGRRGNYGIAIILLTIVVRMILFPLSRKQAASAKKMQDLQPQLTALREKYKDDKDAKERMGRETMELYRKAGVNPFGGCLLAIIQMPIFFGLWQALNNSVALRGARFLWIDSLSAPDQLFPFGTEIPWLGPYFNILPLIVVGLMLVHMRLFQPPATTPEQQMSQKMMKYMMVFMAVMFYKVPSGLGLYFITSSSWAIAERLLLPKHLRTTFPPPAAKEDADRVARPAAPGGKAAPPAPPAPPSGKGKSGWRDRLREKLEDVIEEANTKDRTHRNTGRDKDKDRDQDRKRRPRPRPDRRR